MTTLTVCTTCRRDAARQDRSLDPDGAALLETLRAPAEAAGISLRGVSCLMGCDHGCNVAISAAGKMTYVLGDFTADDMAAEALLAYALLHRDSDSGQVPFRQWPAGVKGHFIARIPPLD